MSRCKRRLLPICLTISLAAIGSACLPSPDDPIQYLQRENSVIVQMKSVSDIAADLGDVGLELTLPEFTLYGDGTLIYLDAGAAGGGQLIRAQLPEEAVRDILDLIVDEGFLNFAYDQPEPDVDGIQHTTFIYVNTRAGTNATRAYALSADVVDDASGDYAEFRRLAIIRELLRTIDPLKLGGSIDGEYEPEAALLFVVSGLETAPIAISEWSHASIDLGQLVAQDGPPGSHIILREDAPSFFDDLTLLATGPTPITVRQNGRLFAVAARPKLLFEENFPEFDQP